MANIVRRRSASLLNLVASGFQPRQDFLVAVIERFGLRLERPCDHTRATLELVLPGRRLVVPRLQVVQGLVVIGVLLVGTPFKTECKLVHSTACRIARAAKVRTVYLDESHAFSNLRLQQRHIFSKSDIRRNLSPDGLSASLALISSANPP